MTFCSDQGMSVRIEVTGAADGEEAISIYALNQADIAVVLTDMTMPIMDGAALIDRLKEMSPQLRIISCSGRQPDSSIQHFVPKPYTAKAMLEALDQILHCQPTASMRPTPSPL